MLNNSIFTRQYYKSYLSRIASLRKEINLQELGKNLDVKNLENLGELDEKPGFYSIIGIFIVEAQNKETIFDECDLVSKKIIEKKYENFIYHIEDENERIDVILDLENNENCFLISGQVLGFLLEKKCGKIFLKDFCYPKKLTFEKKNSEKKICFLANPEICENKISELEILFDNLKNNKENKKLTDLILIGKFLKNDDENQLNLFLNQIQKLNLNIHIIPNIGDPTNFLFPISPINKKIFKIDAKFLSNPCTFEIDKKFQMIPEQSIYSIKKYHNKDFMNILENLDLSRHVCPTAPDTLGCIPYIEDPFIINEKSEFIFSIGNEFKKMIKNETFYFVIPKFNLTKEILFLDLETNEFEIFRLEN